MNEREIPPLDRRGRLRRQLATNAFLGIDSDAHCHDPEATPSIDAVVVPDEPEVSNAVKEQRAILDAAAYWGIDYGSLPRNEA